MNAKIYAFESAFGEMNIKNENRNVNGRKSNREKRERESERKKE